MKIFRNKKVKFYPKYKHLIPENPTEIDFNEAWMQVFGSYPDECVVTNLPQNLKDAGKDNVGFTVMTPDGYMRSHGGFGEHTETPVLKEGQSFYYLGRGCTWDNDANDVRFYLLDEDTNLPCDFDEVLAIGIINNYLSTRLEDAKKYFK